MNQKKENIDFVKWFSELNKNSGPVAGGKGANLSEIYNLKVQVPPGFVITAQAYDYFIKKANLDKEIKELISTINYENTKQLDEVTKKIRDKILKAEIPKEMEEEILESYENLGGSEHESIKRGQAHDILRTASEPIFVAVRSSATTEDLAEASFAGQQDSFVNIKGNDNLLEHIKKCFASLFTSRATYYRNKKGFKNEQTSLAVVIQKMVDSDKSGVIFSKDPSYKNDNVTIEAVWGLGEGIVSGRITPDSYTISKELEILNKTIAEKKIAITRDSSGEKSIVKLREEKSKYQVLKEHEIKKLADIALKLEGHYKKPQDIEFAIEGEEIYIVQTRPITTIGKKAEGEKELKGEPILIGLAASPGIASGKIIIIKEVSDLQKIKQGDILVTKMTNPDMVVAMQKSAAIITDEGGRTSHAAIVSREMGIPAVVGTQEATTKLKEKEIVTVNGFTGKIYKGKIAETVQKEVLPATAKTKTEIKVIVDLPTYAERAAKTKLKKVGLVRIEGIIAESEKHPEYFLKENKIKDYEEIIYKGIKKISQYFEELWIRTSDIRSDEFQNLKGAPSEPEANPMLGFHGIRYSLKKPEIFKAELNGLKKIAEQNKIIGLLLPQVISVDEIKKTKEILKEIGFDNAKVGVMVETPAAVQLIKEICEEGIAFISFGTNDLTQYMLAIDRGNEKVQYLYDEMHPAILYQMAYVIRVCKRYNVETSICGQAGSNKEMVKFLVETGINSISVNADKAAEIAEYVAEIEKSLVAGTDKEPRKYQPEEKSEAEEPKPLPPQITNKEDIEDSEVRSGLAPESKDSNTKEAEPLARSSESKAKEDIDDEEESKEEQEVENKNPHLEKDIQAIEAEKQEYFKEHPEEKESETSPDLASESKNSNTKEEILDIF
ncbi:MAG: phosphoenolpyruvate synthase [Nanoarchaeota archaeon]|nr:phosphoenolpyruvate synthase [Nanoarchaeota archaeon]MBU1027497.1 phosphoenolpyruvate synthase [Nanoarchaeota archaeon]